MVTTKSRAAKKQIDIDAVPEVTAQQPRSRALVFVSHDSRDSDIAEAFANLLSDVSAGTLKSFRSSDKRGNSGIEFGAEWYTSIMSQLDEATDVVALLTARSIDRPWILYEAGVAKGKLGTTVLGLALGVPLDKVSTGPFGQFQNCGDDEDSLTRLVMQLLQRNPDASPREEAVRMQVKLFIQSLSKVLAKTPKKAVAESGGEDQNVAKLFEEVKAMVRELPERVDSKFQQISRRTPNRVMRHMHPKMLEEMLFIGSGPDGRGGAAAAGLLLTLSLVKDDLPWLHEVGMAIYRAMTVGDHALVKSSYKQFQITMEMTMHGPWRRDFFRDDEDSFMLSRYLPEVIDRAVGRYMESTPNRRRIGKSIEVSGETGAG
jgi:hypothetical protein